MPDTHHPQSPRPVDWHQAFATLPQEAPPARAWETLSARLDARRTRRWPAWLALAAALALVALLPLRQAGDGAANGAMPTGAAPVATAPRQDATADSHDSPVAATQVAATRAQPRPTPADVASTAPAAAPARRVAQASPKPTRKQPRATVAGPATEAARPDVANDSAAATLQPLYAESARLEALLSLARDDRVTSASAAIVADALDAQVASIDATLADPALDDARRLQLWRDRVDALRQAAGFEGTQRLLASQGQADALLASVD
jgi:hypothetical protein